VVDVSGERLPMRQDEGPLAALEDIPDLMGLAASHLDMEKGGALCAVVTLHEELDAVFTDVLLF
jgi:hypothetical protein